MYCNGCGTRLPHDANCCHQCGRPVPPAVGPYRRRNPPLERPRAGRKLAGVCLGIANYLDVDVTLVRILAVVAAFLGAGGLVAYVVGWILMPEEPLPLLMAAPEAPPPPRG